MTALGTDAPSCIISLVVGGHWISRLRGAVFVLVPTMLLIDPGNGAGKKREKKEEKKRGKHISDARPRG